MDHSYIAEHSLIERYHLGQLSPDEEMRFEAHFVDCPQCTEELEAARGFQIGIKAVAAEDLARAQAAVQIGLLARLTRLSRQWPGMITGALAAVILTSSWFLMLSPSDPSGSQGPVADTQVFVLSTVRSTEERVRLVSPGEEATQVALAVDVDFDPRITGYRLTVLDSTEQIVWQAGDVQPNDLEVLLVTLPAEFLAPGDYRLTVEGRATPAATISRESYPFRFVR